MLELGEQPAAQLARELGIRRNLLYKWRDQLSAKGDAAFAGPGRRPRGAVSANRAETLAEANVRLTRELADMREERDILKKAAAYFARELP